MGRSYDVDEKGVLSMIRKFKAKAASVEDMVRASRLTSAAQEEYLRIFHDRLNMFRGVSIS